MTDKELWRRMENLATSEPSLEREMSFMLLLKQAYNKDMKLIMSCVSSAAGTGATGIYGSNGQADAGVFYQQTKSKTGKI